MMNTRTALDELLRPTFVLRMAGALVDGDPALSRGLDESPQQKGARTRYRKALRDVEVVLATWAASREGDRHGYDSRREVHPGYIGDPATCLYGSFGWVWINDGQNLVCPVCGLDGT